MDKQTKIPLSVCIMTLNESRNIAACIESVRNAAEILIGDTGSTDDTVAIAREYTDKIFHLSFKGHATTKAELASHAAHRWVLSLDADERVTADLWQEMAVLIGSNQTDVNGMSLRRRSFFLGKKMRIWDDDYQLRLYKKDMAKWNNALIHCGVEVEGRTVQSVGYLDHYTDPNLSHVLHKMNAYTNAGAMYLVEGKKRRITVSAAFIHAFATFLRVYFIKSAILDGRTGLVFACTQAMFNWFRYLKAWEIKQGIAPMPSMKEFMTQ